MKIVIDIPEDIYRQLKDGDNNGSTNAGNTFHNTAFESISNGVVLPKGHGRLIDADEEIKYARKWIKHPNQYISQRNKDFIYYLEKAETVIPADTEVD